MHRSPFLVLAVILLTSALPARPGAQSTGPATYQPTRRVPPSLESVLPHVAPGHDDFPEEGQAAELAARLRALSVALQTGRDRALLAVDDLVAKDVQGGQIVPSDEARIAAGASLEIFRAAKGRAPQPGRRVLRDELNALLGGIVSVDAAEFLIVSAEVDASGDVRTIVRYDIAGSEGRGQRGQRVGTWQMRWRRIGPIWKVTDWSASGQLRSRALAPVFTEVTEAAFGRDPAFERQIRYGNDAWLSALDGALQLDTMALHGLAVGDADGDGRDDLYVSQPSGLPNRLFRNRGDGAFEDVAHAAGVDVLDSTSHALFLDIDNDGDQDLVLVTRTALLLLTNDGRGRFTHVPDAFLLKDPLRGTATSIAAADFDRDGLIDIYLCTYSYFIGSSEDKGGPATPYHDAKNGPPNILFRNAGGGRFVDVTNEVGLNENNDRFSLAAAWADFNGDGWPDLLVANDFGRKNLYQSRGLVGGKVQFIDVAARAGVEDYGAGMSAAWLDYDNDGRLDLYTGNMWTAAGLRVTSSRAFMPDAPADTRRLYARHARGNSLFQNHADGTFRDVTLASQTEMGRWAWSSDALDFDLDGWDDLYVVNGMFTRDRDDHDLDSFFWRQVVAKSPLTKRSGTAYDDGWRAINRMLVADGSQAAHERNVFMRNDGHGAFDDVSGTVGLDVDQDGRAFAATDFDSDGDPDVVVFAPRSSPQLRLFRNDFQSGNASLAVRLRGTSSNRDAIGAIVTLEMGAERHAKVVAAGSGFLSDRPRELLFGLGRRLAPVTLTIRWPNGTSETRSGLPPDHRVWIEERSDEVRVEPLTRSAASTAGSITAPRLRDELPYSASWLLEPFPAPGFNLRDVDGREWSLTSLHGKPSIIIFWSTAANASIEALRSLAKMRDAFAAAGVGIVAIAVDEKPDEETLRRAAQETGLPVMPGGSDVPHAYSIAHRYIFARRQDFRLPTIFLLNGNSNIERVYRIRIDAAQIVADVGLLNAPAAERLRRAVPFAGTFYAPPRDRQQFQYALELGEQGFDEQAIGAFQQVVQSQPSAVAFYNLGTLQMKSGNPPAATVAFKRAIDLKPEYSEANNSLGALLAQSGDIQGAIARFRAALEASPGNPDALNNLGFALFQIGQATEALNLYERALKARPEFPEALNNLGIFYGRQGQLDRAEPFFRRAVAGRSGYGDAANNLAIVLAGRGDPEGAIAVLEKALGQDPAFETGHVTLCRLYLNLGRPQQAQEVIQSLLQRNPKHAVGLQLLQQIRGQR